MELGEKIRQARLEKGISQRQLCGDTVTRNMLSQIENGSARPSMDTLAYFARQLDKPISWFLDEKTVVSPNQAVMEEARQCFLSGEYEKTVQILEDYKEPDSLFDAEQNLLLGLSLMQLAQPALEQGKKVYALTLLEKALQAGEKTPYFTPAVKREWALCMYRVAPEQASGLLQQIPQDDAELLLRGQVAADQGDMQRSEALLEAAVLRDSRWFLLRGRTAMAQGQYREAAAHFHKAETEYPEQCAKALEKCYRELEDFKMAYHYACKQRENG